MEKSAPIRAFIAIELPYNVKTELINLIDKLRNRKSGFVRWVNPQGIHLTLKFLGNVNPSVIDDINNVIASAASECKRFSIDISGLGFFPNARKPRVFWVGIEGNTDILLKLQEDIDTGTEKFGFPREKRRFSPHLTLARINEDAPAADLENFVNEINRLHFTKKFHMEVDAVSLMRSELLRTGAKYTRLFEAPLQGEIK